MDKNKSQVPIASHQHNKMTNERTLLEDLLKDHCLEESLKHNVKAGITHTNRQLLESVVSVSIGDEERSCRRQRREWQFGQSCLTGGKIREEG